MDHKTALREILKNPGVITPELREYFSSAEKEELELIT
jgi:hypothetical protein